MRKISDSKLGFEVGSGLKKSQSKYNYEGMCKLYGIKEKKEKIMKREDIKIGQKVSFYYWGKRKGDVSALSGDKRMVHGVIKKINKVTVEVWEIEKDGSWGWSFWRKPSELIKESK